MPTYNFRKFINDLHLWLGLASGLILFIVCLTGTTLTFEEDIKHLFAEPFTIETSEAPKSLEELTELMAKEGSVNAVTIPTSKHEPYSFSIKTSAEQRRGSTFYVDPYTGYYREKGASSLDDFFRTMFKMHRWLLLDSDVGRPIVGIATIIFFFLSLSGLILWFPKKIKWKTLKSGLKIKYSANWKRINHDLHNTLGFYACIFLVVMTLTGLFWSFGWYRDAASTLLGTEVFGNRRGQQFESTFDATSTSLDITDILNISKQQLAYDGDVTISIPKSSTEVFHVSKSNTANLSPIIRDRLIIDRDGSILSKDIFKDKPLNVQIASLIKPIHTGEIFGTISKMLYFLACLIGTSLPITGTLIWWNKLKKKRKRKTPKL